MEKGENSEFLYEYLIPAGRARDRLQLSLGSCTCQLRARGWGWDQMEDKNHELALSQQKCGSHQPVLLLEAGPALKLGGVG